MDHLIKKSHIKYVGFVVGIFGMFVTDRVLYPRSSNDGRESGVTMSARSAARGALALIFAAVVLFGLSALFILPAQYLVFSVFKDEGDYGIGAFMILMDVTAIEAAIVVLVYGMRWLWKRENAKKESERRVSVLKMYELCDDCVICVLWAVGAVSSIFVCFALHAFMYN
eukprot:m.192115 g.192115  ORF g.192115 m.192115 type:complete len:169 (-) comp32452_c0_seq11:51-557(-)